MTTVTDHRVKPFSFLFLKLYAVQEFVTVDDVEVSSKEVAAFPLQSDAVFEAQRRGRAVVED